MMKKFILSALMLLGVFGLRAQQVTPLDLDPDVKHGVLSNGLTYYILHNELPKNRANFYIAQKVGSSLETPDQLGLAHFLEHMAFNGTTNYPGHALLDYLQSKGLRFGADINAYTGFDQTVYNINGVTTTDEALMDSVLLALYDWSGSILLEEAEIDAERGVIEGEWRSRNDATTRMYTTILPKLYEEYQYQQMPIGKMEVVRNFKPQVLRDYYEKWYRPDLQGIIIVGDFDADVMEQKVIKLFSQVPAQENPAERVYPHISDNEKPNYVTFSDPELQYPLITVCFKFDKTPFELRNTLESFLTDDLVPSLICSMINERLSEYSKDPECPYSEAAVGVGSYYVSSQKGSFNIYILPKDNVEAAFNGAMATVAQACKMGFNGPEIVRARDQILSEYEKAFNEKDKTNNDAKAQELIANFTENTPAPGVETEFQIASMVLPSIPVEAFNQIAGMLLHPDNQVIVVSQPQTPDLVVPAENDMIAAMNSVLDADYPPYQGEEITEPLIAQMPKDGAIVETSKFEDLDAQQYLLSNGVKVLVKPTDFSNDEILLMAFKKGGMESYAAVQAPEVMSLGEILNMVQIGAFNTTKMEKYLAGKHVNLNFGIGNSTSYFDGYSTKKDLGTLFELIYASFTDVSPDQKAFDSSMATSKIMIANQEKDPSYIFRDKIVKTEYGNNPFIQLPSVDLLNSIKYPELINIYKESVKNAADFTFVIVGNIDEKELKDYLVKYIASLPSTGMATVPAIVTPLDVVPGQIIDEFEIASQNPQVLLFDCLSQEGLPFNVENQVKMDLLGDIVDMLFIETLREEMGGTYSPEVWTEFSPFSKAWTLNWYVVTNEAQQKDIRDRAMLEVNNLLTNGADVAKFNKVKEAAIKQYENAIRRNRYWVNGLRMAELGYNVTSNHKAALENLTIDEFNNFLKNLYNGKNRIEIVGIAK